VVEGGGVGEPSEVGWGYYQGGDGEAQHLGWFQTKWD